MESRLHSHPTHLVSISCLPQLSWPLLGSSRGRGGAGLQFWKPAAASLLVSLPAQPLAAVGAGSASVPQLLHSSPGSSCCGSCVDFTQGFSSEEEMSSD